MQGNAPPGQWPLKGMKTLILIAPWAQQICGRARFGAKPHAGAGRERNGIIRLYDCSLRPPRAPNRHPAADLSPPRPSFLPRGTHPEPLAHVHRPHDGQLRLTNIHAGLRVGRVQTVCISFSHYDILMLRQSAFAADRKGVCTRLAYPTALHISTSSRFSERTSITLTML